MARLYMSETEILGYENKKLNMAGGMGPQVQFALSQYTSRLGNLSSQGFGPNDASTAHAVIDELIVQMNKIAEITDDLDDKIDDLVRVLEMIIDKENKLADSVMEV